ncbi:MAG: hypothetical protein EOP42_08110 [Sphingobacteriaceae bacterium]|nr:MAG: hypothetical protein EOP42_08110 [Sphingobacteriaceae bacterium]
MKEIEENPDEILVIGNGFDLNLGLDTSYSNFVKSESFNNICTNGNTLCQYLQGKHDLQNWIDIENELKEYEKQLSNNNFQNEFDDLCKALIEYLNKIDVSKLKTTGKAYTTLENLKSSNFLIFDYNYTSTVENLLKRFGLPESEIDRRVVKIHGSLLSNEIIFGIEDSVYLKSPKNIFLKKSASPIFVDVDLNSYLSKAVKTSFFGHSLGESDHMYFKDFFGNAANLYHPGVGKIIDIYYYKQQSYYQLQAQLDNLANNKLGQLRRLNKVTYIDSSP